MGVLGERCGWKDGKGRQSGGSDEEKGVAEKGVTGTGRGGG